MKIGEIYFLVVTVVMGFYGCLCVKKVFMVSLKGILKLWEEINK